MFNISYQEQRMVQEKLQAEAARERILKGITQANTAKVRGLWKMIISLVF